MGGVHTLLGIKSARDIGVLTRSKQVWRRARRQRPARLQRTVGRPNRKPEVDIPCINLADTCLHKKDGVEPGRRHGASHGQAPERLALSPVLRRRFRLSASTPSRQLIGPVADGPADRSWMWA